MSIQHSIVGSLVASATWLVVVPAGVSTAVGPVAYAQAQAASAQAASVQVGSAQAGQAGAVQASAAGDSKSSGETKAVGNVGLLGRDNVVFARELYRRGYPDLAELMCQAVEAGGKSGAVERDELVAVRAMYLDLRLDGVRNESDLQKRKDLVKGILKEKEAFIANNIQSAEAKAAQETLPDVYRLLGETLIALIRKETDDKQRAFLREEGQEAFNNATEELKQQRDQLKQRMDDMTEEPPNELLYAHRDASFNLARTYYFNSLLYPQGDSQQIVLLNRTKDEFNEFALTYGDQILSYEGLIMLGLAYKDMGGADNEEEALKAFDDAIKLRETYVAAEDGTFDMPDEAANVVSSAVLQKVNLLSSLKRYDDIDATAEDFYKTTESFHLTERGLAVLAAHLDAMIEKGDSEKGRELAERLDKLGAGTQWSSYGKRKLSEFLGSGGVTAGADRLLAIGKSLIDETPDRAISVLHQARAAAKGDKNEQDIGAECLFYIGLCYEKTDNLLAAALAYEASSDLYQDGKLAPIALSTATTQWRRLNKATKYTTFKARIEGTQDALLKRYPNHPAAADVLLADCREREEEKKYLEAAQCYLAIKQDSPMYREAQISAAQTLYQHANYLIQQEKKTPAEAKAFIDQVEPIVERIVPQLEAEMTKTLDLQQQSRFARFAFQGRKVLASTFLLVPGSEAKALKVLEPVETTYVAYPQYIGQTWTLRIVAHEKRGTLPEAMRLIEGILLKDPNTPGISSAAGVLADALYDQAYKERERSHESTQADDLQKKAANYYRIYVAPMLKDGQGATAGRLAEVGKRMYIFGLDINRLPENQPTFVGWQPTGKSDTSYFQDAARMLQASLALQPSYQNAVFLGRSYGFLGKWKEAGDVYGKLFEQERIVDPKTDTLMPSAMRNKVELVSGYLEFGVAEHMTALASSDKARFDRAKSIFFTLAKTYKDFPDTAMYWQSRYYLCRNLYDTGDYDGADFQISNIETTVSKNFDEGKFGYKDDFVKLKGELAGKVLRKPGDAPTKAGESPSKPR